MFGPHNKLYFCVYVCVCVYTHTSKHEHGYRLTEQGNMALPVDKQQKKAAHLHSIHSCSFLGGFFERRQSILIRSIQWESPPSGCWVYLVTNKWFYYF